MSVVKAATRANSSGLPGELSVAQEAIYLPEVQEMLRRLSEYNLGIYMPHMHNEDTGAFQPLPSDVVQVEDALEVSFRSAHVVESKADRFVPVGWVWRDDGVRAMMKCVTYCSNEGTGSMHTSRHKQVPET